MSAITRALAVFQQYRNGQSTESWLQLGLSLHDYVGLWKHLEQDHDLKGYIEDKVR